MGFVCGFFIHLSAAPVLSLQAISSVEALRDRPWSRRGTVGLRQHDISLSKEYYLTGAERKAHNERITSHRGDGHTAVCGLFS